MQRSKTIVVALPVLLILLVLVMYNHGYLRVRTELTGIKEEQAASLKTLEKYVTFISGKPELEKRLAALTEERKADVPKLIEGQTPSLAAATLQEIIKGIIISNGGTISSERVGRPEDYNKFKLISVSIDAVVPDVRALGDILYNVETRTPYLVVKELDSRVRDFKNPRELMIKLDVSALTAGK